MRRPSAPVAAALAGSAAVLLARLFPAPALHDPAGAALPAALHLAIPPLYLALAPLFALWDGVALLSIARIEGFLQGLAVAYVAWRVLRRIVRRRRVASAAWREAAVLALAVVALAAFVLGGALWHRPMARLAGVPDSLVAVDFHTHTAYSRDVRGTLVSWYGLEANRRWHAAAGYDVAFVTDHNRRTLEEPSLSPDGGPALCPGTEIGAWRAHVVVLGRDAPDDRPHHKRDFDGLVRLLGESRARGAPAILSIPEYERNHRDRLGELLLAGAAGLEISNGSPKANALAGARRDTVIELARAHDATIVGVSDHHGWGATAMSWSLVPRPPTAAGAELCDAIVARVRNAGFDAAQAVERHRVEPGSAWPMLLTPAAVLWEGWRAATWPLALAWLAWIWAAVVFSRWSRRSASRPTGRHT